MLLLNENMGGYGSEKVSSNLSFNFNTSFLFKHARIRNWRDQNSGDTRSSIQHSNKPKRFVDSRSLLTRKQIDEAKVPVLFVELHRDRMAL